MTEKLTLIAPEIALFVTTCVVMVLGLSPSLAARKMCAWISGLGLVIAAGLAVPAVLDVQTASAATGIFPSMQPYMKGLIAVVGLMLLPMMSGTVDREMETMIAAGRAKYEALRANRAEFYSFFLFSLTGLMLTVSADDLIWLFLALELTSLPTYIMVTISTRSTRSQEAGVKYFFIGALGAAVFLYGFALLYGATGSTSLAEIHRVLAAQEFGPEGGLSPIAIAGLVISLLGLGVKIAAVPMHFYVADVYQGAAAGVTAMLAFVPKAAGFVAIILLAGAVGWGHEAEPRQLPDALHWTLWILAAATMTAGNVLAALQSSVKRMLAYSSIAHSGYMLAGVMAGPGERGFFDDGIAAVLFYLLCYGVMNVGAFAVLAAIERRDGRETDEIDDIRGLHRRHPHLAAAMLLCSLSLLGLPPLLGFFGKLGLFTAVISTGTADMYALAVVLGINSAIAAFYYLRLVMAAYIDAPDEAREAELEPVARPTRTIAAMVSAGGVVVLLAVVGPLMGFSLEAAGFSSELDGAGFEAGRGAQLEPETPTPAPSPEAD